MKIKLIERSTNIKQDQKQDQNVLKHQKSLEKQGQITIMVRGYSIFET